MFFFFAASLIVFGASAQKTDSLLNALKNQESSERVNTYILLSEAFHDIDPGLSETYMDTALQIAINTDIDSLIARVSYNKGTLALDKGLLDEALAMLKKAYLHLPPDDNQEKLAEILDKTGEAFARSGKLDSALTVLYQSQDIREELPDINSYARTFIKLGNVYYLNGNLSSALKNFKRALGYFRETGSTNGMATSYMNMGSVYEELGNIDSARTAYFEALKGYRDIENFRNITLILNNLGVFHYERANYDSAIYYYQQSVEIAQKLNDFYQIAILYNNMALIEDIKKEFKKARADYQKALRLATENGYKILAIDIYRNLAENCAISGLYKDAYQYYKKYQQISDSLHNMETKERLAKLQMNYEKEQEIEEIQNRNNLKQLRYSYTIVVLLFVILLIILLLFIIFKSNRQKKKVNKTLLEKNKEVIRQRELQERTLLELQENQRKTNAILKAIPDVMFIFDAKGNYIDYHAKKDKDIIKTGNSLIGSNVKKELPEEFANKILQGISRASKENKVQVFMHNDWVNMRKLDMELRITPIEDGTFLMIARNVTERLNMERELKKARDEMQKALDAKSMYLASLSHEIRTPLTSIIGVTSILEETELTKEQKECTDIINISGNNLLNLINNILDFAKIESGQLKLEEVEINLTEVMEEVVSLLEVKARDSNNKIDFRIDKKLNNDILGDPYRLTQILINLVNNAIKFTKNGIISIHSEVLDEDENNLLAKFQVIDTGIGVSVEQRDKLFQAFSQADQSIARKYGGSGLGLAISKHFVQLMNGEIGLESEEGKGSKFWFTVKFKKDHKQPTNEETKENREKGKNNMETENEKPLNILLVEDNLLNQKFAIAILKKYKHHIDVAENGKIGVEYFDKNDYDVILMDIQMPVMDGIEATRNIRQMEKEKGQDPTRIVAVTAYAMEGDEERFYQAGIDDYLRKPYKADQLIGKLYTDRNKEQ